MIDCDWCRYWHHKHRGYPNHIGMLHLCDDCVRGVELQRRLRSETP